MNTMPAKKPARLRFSLAYAASGGTSRTDARLTIDESGDARMYLGSTMSLPPAGDLDTVGMFEGPVDARLRSRLTSLLADLPDRLPAGETVAVPGSVVRNLVVTGDSDLLCDVAIPGYASPPLDEIETVLQKIMAKLLGHPAEAVRLTIEAGGAFVLAGVGTRSVDLAEMDALRGTLVHRDRRGAVLGTQRVTPPEGSTRSLAPGEELRIPISPPAGTGSFSGGLEFGMVIDGQLRRIRLQAKPVVVK
jgi:hypothetical protein